jgi:hypothetical protein
MIEHYEDPGSFQLEVKKNINERIVACCNKVLPEISACCRHIGIWIIWCMVNKIGPQLSIKPAVCLFESEKMFKKAG